MRSLGSRFFPNQSESTPVPTSLSASSYTYPTPVWMKSDAESDAESDAAMQRGCSVVGGGGHVRLHRGRAGATAAGGPLPCMWLAHRSGADC
jgi:hypothetical protein